MNPSHPDLTVCRASARLAMCGDAGIGTTREFTGSPVRGNLWYTNN